MTRSKIITTLFASIFIVCEASIPWNTEQKGDFTYYNDAGYGSCGTTINAASEDLVAISHLWFTNSNNPNNDEYCTSNVCVKVSYNGNSVTVPVKDKCPGCTKEHLDLSKTAFEKLASLDLGHVYGATWSFVSCSGASMSGGGASDSGSSGSSGGGSVSGGGSAAGSGTGSSGGSGGSADSSGITWGYKLTNSYTSTNVGYAAECKANCVKDKRCAAMAYDSDSGNCSLFTTKYKKQSDDSYKFATWFK